MSRIEEAIDESFKQKYKQKAMELRNKRLMLNKEQLHEITSFVKSNKDKLLENMSLSYDIGKLTYSVILAETSRDNVKATEFDNATSVLFWWKGLPIGCVFSNKKQAAELEPNSSYLLVGTIYKSTGKDGRQYTKLNVFGLIKAEDMQADMPKHSEKQEQEIEPEIEKFFS